MTKLHENQAPVLFVDTETTGLVKHDQDLDHPSQPHIVQIGMVLHDDQRHEVACVSLIVLPPSPIPQAASAIHGINDAKAELFGIRPRGAVGLFARLLGLSKVLVAFNAEFDMTMLRVEAMRADVPIDLSRVLVRCPMSAATPVMKLPPTERMMAAGYGDKHKPPKLSEAYQALCGKELVGAHDALADARACAEVYYALVDLGAWKAAV